MKKLIGLLLVAGCCSLPVDYVKQDRRNYETLAPRIRKLLETSDYYDEDQEADIEDRLQAWDFKTAQALASIAEVDSE